MGISVCLKCGCGSEFSYSGEAGKLFDDAFDKWHEKHDRCVQMKLDYTSMEIKASEAHRKILHGQMSSGALQGEG